VRNLYSIFHSCSVITVTTNIYIFDTSGYWFRLCRAIIRPTQKQVWNTLCMHIPTGVSDIKIRNLHIGWQKHIQSQERCVLKVAPQYLLTYCCNFAPKHKSSFFHYLVARDTKPHVSLSLDMDHLAYFCRVIYDLKEKRRYWKLKEEALDRT
jgi:hypothetical protein